MTTTAAALIEGVVVDATGTTYTSAQCQTSLDKVTAVNVSGAIATATVQLLSPDGTSTQTISKAIPAGRSWPFPEVVGHVLEIDGAITVSSTDASAINFRVSGRKFT